MTYERGDKIEFTDYEGLVRDGVVNYQTKNTYETSTTRSEQRTKARRLPEGVWVDVEEDFPLFITLDKILRKP